MTQFNLNKEDFQETHNLMKKLVQNKCVNPPGNELISIQTIYEHLAERGIKSQIFKSDVNRGVLFTKITGKNTSNRQLIFGPSHVDVVPISNPSDWTTDPFKGEIHDGFMFGRGVSDMLFIVSSQVIVFEKVFEENIPLDGDLTLLIVSDEESGGKFGAYWFLKNHLDLLNLDEKLESYAITEGGGQVLYNKYLSLRVGERGTNWKKITIKGKPGHGAFPYKNDNALVKASRIITKIDNYVQEQMPLNIEYAKEMIVKMQDVQPLLKYLLTEDQFKETLSKLYKSDPKIASGLFGVTHLTFSPNVCKSGVKTNIIPGIAELEVDIRTLPGQSDKDIYNHLEKALGEDYKSIEITDIITNGQNGNTDDLVSIGTSSPDTGPFVDAIIKTVSEIEPELIVIPSIIGGGTDARFCRVKGINAYGFAIMNPKLSPEEIGPAHGINEKIDIETINLTVKAYYLLVKNYLFDK
ncbi:MAG: M20/M25/M40 family metallo-hydrolase [Candidatus Thorarchaeota archaeon]